MGRKSIEELVKEAKGINIHGHSLRISFQYQGSRVRETLGLEPTKANLKYAINLRSAVTHDISTGNFDYTKRFPDGKNQALFGVTKKDKSIRLGNLAKKYMDMKKSDIGIQSIRVYEVSMDQCVDALGKERVFSSLIAEDILLMRNILVSTRKAKTVNSYLVIFRSFLEFALNNGYTDKDLYKSAKPFKAATNDPDPLEIDEFEKIIHTGCKNEMDKNMITLAVYTGLRTGELCALAWEDINLENKTITIKRTITQKREFKLTKTNESRVVYLMPPALEAIKKQRVHTFMMPSETIDVHQVDKQETKQLQVRPVFRAGMVCPKRARYCWFTVITLRQKWEQILKNADVRHRVQYQTRHTYACWGLTAHGNVAFIAKQMGHKDLSMVIKIYGKWMESSSQNESDFIWSELSKKGHNVQHVLSQK